MDARDWLYIKIFAGIYILVTGLSVLTQNPSSDLYIAPWQVGVYAAIAGTLLFAAILVGKD